MQEYQRFGSANRSSAVDDISIGSRREDIDAALALNAANLSFKLIEQYQIHLNELVFSVPRDTIELDNKDYQKASTKLRSEFSRQALTLLWKESKFVSNEALTKCGFEKIFKEGDINKNSLATAYCRAAGIVDLDKHNAIKTDIQRLSWAAEAFGLISQSNSEGQSKPLEGTQLLNKLMISTNMACVKIILQTLRGVTLGQCSDGESS